MTWSLQTTNENKMKAANPKPQILYNGRETQHTLN